MGALKLIRRFFASDNGVMVLVALGIALVIALWPVLQRVPWPTGAGTWFNRALALFAGSCAVLIAGRWSRQLFRAPSQSLWRLIERPISAGLNFLWLALVVTYVSSPVWSGIGERAWDFHQSRSIFLVLPLLNAVIQQLDGRSPRSQAAPRSQA